jgi:hypothetical protein
VVQSIGVGGPVTFNIRTGTYAGGVFFFSIPGSSAVNNVTFKSQANHRDSVVISYNAGATDNYVVKFFNASNITLRSLTLTALNATNARVIEFAGNATSDTIDNCRLNSMPSTSTAQTLTGVYADNFSGSNNAIRNNLIMNGTTGIFSQERQRPFLPAPIM